MCDFHSFSVFFDVYSVLFLFYSTACMCVDHSFHGPSRECLRARRFRATLLLHITCVQSCCSFLPLLCGGKTEKQKETQSSQLLSTEDTFHTSPVSKREGQQRWHSDATSESFLPGARLIVTSGPPVSSCWWRDKSSRLECPVDKVWGVRGGSWHKQKRTICTLSARTKKELDTPFEQSNPTCTSPLGEIFTNSFDRITSEEYTC